MNLDEILTYIDANPGAKYYVMKAKFISKGNDRILDRALQRLRRLGKIVFRAGGWYIK